MIFSLDWATYHWAGVNQDYSTGIATDDDGDVFLVGFTNDDIGRLAGADYLSFRQVITILMIRTMTAMKWMG